MRKSIAILAFLVILGFLLMGAMQMREFGDPDYPTYETEDYGDQTMDDFFIEDSQPHDETNNVVTAVLFDYRGLDTLGEASILFSAVTGVLTVLRKMKKVEKGKENEEGGEVP